MSARRRLASWLAARASCRARWMASVAGAENAGQELAHRPHEDDSDDKEIERGQEEMRAMDAPTNLAGEPLNRL